MQGWVAKIMQQMNSKIIQSSTINHTGKTKSARMTKKVSWERTSSTSCLQKFDWTLTTYPSFSLLNKSRAATPSAYSLDCNETIPVKVALPLNKVLKCSKHTWRHSCNPLCSISPNSKLASKMNPQILVSSSLPSRTWSISKRQTCQIRASSWKTIGTGYSS